MRLEGKGTHLNSYLLKRYILQCLEENRSLFQVDLSQCNYMDSTFLGMLAGLGIKMEKRSLPQIKLMNPTERIRGLLEGLGVEQLFRVIQEDYPISSFNELHGKELGKEEKSREMLEAHEKLVQISQSNNAKFRDVITLLRKKVNKP